MPIRRRTRRPSRGRACRMDGCDASVSAGHAYCAGHSDAPEAEAFRRELQSAAAYLTPEVVDPAEVERADAFQRFKTRAQHGQFDLLFDAPTRRMLEQAARLRGVELEVGALRFGLARVMTEETDPSRMAHALARLSTAVIRAQTADAVVAVKREQEIEAEWIDRVTAAMLGYTLDGQDFARSRAAAQANRNHRSNLHRWDAARRAKEEADEAAARREVEERRKQNAYARSVGWQLPYPDLEPTADRPPLVEATPDQPTARDVPPDQVGGSPDGAVPLEPVRDWPAWEFVDHQDDDQDDDQVDEQDDEDRATMARLAERRADALARWGRQQAALGAARDRAARGLTLDMETEPSAPRPPRIARGVRRR